MGKRILYVDDDKDWRFLAETTLRDAGYDIYTAPDASEAMVAVDMVKPDLVILDLDLGGENGMMLLKFLKQNSPEIRVMIYTGKDQDGETIMSAMELGAHSFVRKGTMEDLLRELETVFA